MSYTRTQALEQDINSLNRLLNAGDITEKQYDELKAARLAEYATQELGYRAALAANKVVTDASLLLPLIDNLGEWLPRLRPGLHLKLVEVPSDEKQYESMGEALIADLKNSKGSR
jgi:hypothetical protein